MITSTIWIVKETTNKYAFEMFNQTVITTILKACAYTID